MRACLRCAAAAVPARRSRRHLEPWHEARGAGRLAAARVSSGAMSSPDTEASAAGVSASGDSSRDAPSSPSERVPRAATPMRGMIGDKHPSVNLPPLPLPTRAEGEGGGSGVDSGDGFLVVGRDFNRARFDPVANSKFLDDRPWGAVDAFARKLVLGEVCLSSLVAPVDGTVDGTAEISGAGGECTTSPVDERTRTPRLDPAAPCDGEGVDPSGLRLRDAPPLKPRKTPRHTYRFSVRYYGPGFKGWAWSADDEKYFAPSKRNDDDESPLRRTEASDAPWSVGAFSASAATQKALAPLFANDTTKTKPLWCAGRTDKGVHGLAQTVSFVAANDLNDLNAFPETVKRLVEASPAGRLGHLRVVETPAPRETHRNFHATFCATWRRYVYVFPMRQSMREERTPERTINVALLNEMLGKLVERSRASADAVGISASVSASKKKGVDCYAFARDTVPGKDSFVKFLEARAFLGRVPTPSDDARRDSTKKEHEDVVVIELVADRFLRKLVRVLVATAAREAATGAAPDVLLKLADARERTATASAAPPSGLFFAGVGYGDHPEYDEA